MFLHPKTQFLFTKLMMAAPPPPQATICAWPFSTSSELTGYLPNPPPHIQSASPPKCGSFSVKNFRPLEVTWTTVQGECDTFSIQQGTCLCKQHYKVIALVHTLCNTTPFHIMRSLLSTQSFRLLLHKGA
jgi:hypothetical protein